MSAAKYAPHWVETKTGYVCTNWPPPHYPSGCVEFSAFVGHMNAQAEAAYQRGQDDAAKGIHLEKPWLYIGADLSQLAEHIADAKAFMERGR